MKEHHKHHHHHKHEMEHHKHREMHKKHHHAVKSEEYSHHPHMIDNKHVKEDHQEGISRVMQRKGDMEVGQHGSMSGGWKKKSHGKWNNEERMMTPRQG